MNGEDSGAPLPTDPVPENIRVFGDFTAGTPRERMVGKLAANLSVANSRALKGADACKQNLLIILDFSTGVKPETKVVGRLRCFNRLFMELQQRMAMRGKMCMLLSLPPDWSEQGLVQIVGYGSQPGTLEIQHRSSGQAAVVGAADVPLHDDIVELEAPGRGSTCKYLFSGLSRAITVASL